MKIEIQQIIAIIINIIKTVIIQRKFFLQGKPKTKESIDTILAASVGLSEGLDPCKI
jgi:acid phosphatase family membrane protein YuiD